MEVSILHWCKRLFCTYIKYVNNWNRFCANVTQYTVDEFNMIMGQDVVYGCEVLEMVITRQLQVK
jgi:hypothetical protein